MRIGDAEREVALTALGEHFAQGRITRDEYDERSDAVWTAKHADDLAPLFADLPQGSPLGPVRTAVPGRVRASRGFGDRFGDRFAGLPTPVQVVLVVLAAGFVVSNLPFVLLAGLLWFVLARHGVVARPPWAGRHGPRRGCAR
ncbi:DUF1707 SHOCT-like domain-containing protein [Nocardioides marmoraquaticus]